jgi:hypothetical protein
MVPDTWEIFDATTANKDNAVLLKVVTFATNVRDDLKTVGEADFGNFTQGRVWLFGSRGVDASANPTTLRTTLHRRRF